MATLRGCRARAKAIARAIRSVLGFPGNADALVDAIARTLECLAAARGARPAGLPPLPPRPRLHRALDLLGVPRERDGAPLSLEWRLDQLLLAGGEAPPPRHPRATSDPHPLPRE